MIIAHASQVLTIDDPAFVHAVGLAGRSGAAARGIHIARGVAPEPSPPAADSLLERWGRRAGAVDHAWLLAPGGEDTADALLDAIAALKPQLLIVNTHARRGLARLFVGSVAEGVARNAALPVLLLPSDGPTLVDAQDGAVTLERALLLAGPLEDTERAAEGLSALVKLAGGARCCVELLHIQDGTSAPHAALPPGFEVTLHRSPGPLERAVAERAREYEPNLIVMTSHGHDQLSDIVFSSHTERVLHEVRRPLLWVPARA
jgi:nucleotide-binding universal stress UspA family protein